jgi:hypothetical protein
LALEPPGTGDVVVIESGDIAPARNVEAAVQRCGEPGLLVVPQDRQSFLADSGQELGGRVRRGVVYDDQLEVSFGLSQHAVHRVAEVARAIVDGEEERDEGHGRLAYGA